MVRGTRTRARSTHSVQLEYLIQIQEIKSWPPTQSLRAHCAVPIRWEHDDRSSGLTNQISVSQHCLLIYCKLMFAEIYKEHTFFRPVSASVEELPAARCDSILHYFYRPCPIWTDDTSSLPICHANLTRSVSSMPERSVQLSKIGG